MKKNLLLSYPLPDGVEPIPNEVLLPPKFALQIVSEARTAPTIKASIDPTLERRESQPYAAEYLRRLNSPLDISTTDNLPESSTQGNLNNQVLTSIVLTSTVPSNNTKSISDNSDLSTAEMLDLRSPFEPPGPLPCSQLKEPHPDAATPVDFDLPISRDPPCPNGYRIQLLSNIRVTPYTHWQDVRELTFKINHEHGYDPGDTITIFPKNFPQDVQSLIDLQDWNEVADKPIKIAPEAPDFFSDSDLMELVPGGVDILTNTTLRDLLTCYFDITAIPKRRFFMQIAHHTEDQAHKERLREFANPSFTDEYYDYAS